MDRRERITHITLIYYIHWQRDTSCIRHKKETNYFFFVLPQGYTKDRLTERDNPGLFSRRLQGHTHIDNIPIIGFSFSLHLCLVHACIGRNLRTIWKG